MHDVATHARRPRDLEDGGIGHYLGDRRAAGAVALRRVAALVEEALGEAADDGGVLVVEGDGESGLADRREELVELAHVVAGEAHRVILVGRDLEGADSGVREVRDALGARALLRRAVEGDVDDGDPLQGLHFGLKQVDRVTGSGSSKGMSTMVVTPPAAAATEASASPAIPSQLPAWTWPSMTPGKIRWPAASTVSAASGAAPVPSAPIAPSRTARKPSASTRSGSTRSPRTTRSNIRLRP